MKNKVVISIDLGGTYFKAALVNPVTGQLVSGTYLQQPSYSEAGREVVLEALRNVISQMLTMCRGAHVERIAVDAPGPFDYSRGACIMQHKFQTIYGIPLEPVISSVPGAEGIPVLFHHDLHACTYGAWLYDKANGYDRVFCIAVGTGLGTGCLQEGRIVMKSTGDPQYPIFSTPYGEGMVEDIVSNRGLVQAYRDRTGDAGNLDAREIQLRAEEQSDKVAIEVYCAMGSVLGAVIRPLLEQLQTECLVLGGQISKGYHLFGPALESALEGLSTLTRIAPIKDIQAVTIRGNAALPAVAYKEKPL